MEATGSMNRPAGNNGSALVETESPVKACAVLDRERVSVLAFEHRCASIYGAPVRSPWEAPVVIAPDCVSCPQTEENPSK